MFIVISKTNRSRRKAARRSDFTATCRLVALRAEAIQSEPAHNPFGVCVHYAAARIGQEENASIGRICELYDAADTLAASV